MSQKPEEGTKTSPYLKSIENVYHARDSSDLGRLYDPLRPVNVRTAAERQRIFIDLLRNWLGSSPLFQKDILEIGCGTGGNLLNLLSLGANPGRLVGNDLLESRLSEARARLPSSIQLISGDAGALDLPDASFDLVLQSVCFSSILDDSLLASVADRAWKLLRPGGAFLSYDFVVNNPRNPNVRGISVGRLRSLFPESQFTARRVTLAPPIARAIWSGCYPLLSAVPFLRTHAWCSIRKSHASDD
jgi:SAM-dependent methyltransferase